MYRKLVRCMKRLQDWATLCSKNDDDDRAHLIAETLRDSEAVLRACPKLHLSEAFKTASFHVKDTVDSENHAKWGFFSGSSANTKTFTIIYIYVTSMSHWLIYLTLIICWLYNIKLVGHNFTNVGQTMYVSAMFAFVFAKFYKVSIIFISSSYERSAKPQLKNAIFGSKLSFLGVHYIVLQYILIASFASPGKLRAESLFTPPLQRLKHVWLPCAFFCSAPTVWYGMIPVNATAITVAPSFLKLRNKFEFSCWKKSGWALTATCSMPFIHSPASG